MATGPRPTSTRRSPAAAAAKTTPTAAPRRRPGAVRRAKAAAVPPIAAAPEVHVAAAITPLEERIRVRAYYLHLERQGRPADPVADWLRAQREIAAGGFEA